MSYYQTLIIIDTKYVVNHFVLKKDKFNEKMILLILCYSIDEHRNRIILRTCSPLVTDYDRPFNCFLEHLFSWCLWPL